ncbi:inactive protein RESTRICTED TEV MOVEMENT 1-like [Solanum stenotomum]|uniref:inactive protein RESTRICTED TEV MOVEMENT 1-like n=1 Tax=Solanum stenotomum TaxID=172797 RepID=UPI0020D0464D|nr:inactive protein RESTRICTED TEV MOVEMENT 1-like [Solanum stenotomum]
MNKQIDMIKYGVKKEGPVWDEKGKSEIAKIFIYSGAESYFVNSLQFLFVEDGQFILSQLHGADYNYSLNTNFSTVVLDYPSEFLTGIQGTFYRTGLRSIKFVTNKNVYGPYGSDKIDPKFQYKEFNVHLGDDRSFGGFHGTKSESHIESIGIYMKPVTSSMITNSSDKVQKSKKKTRY